MRTHFIPWLTMAVAATLCVASTVTAQPCDPGAVGAVGASFSASPPRCYYAFSDLLTWGQSKAACEAIEGYLAVIDSAEENEVARAASSLSDGPWIGFNDIAVEAGTNALGFVNVFDDPLVFNGFNSPGEPSGPAFGDEDCVHFLSGYSVWNDLGCDLPGAFLQNGYLCEVEVSCEELDCDDGNFCTLDSCDAQNGCTHAAGNAGGICRPAAGGCDVAEQCDGASTTCPTDLLANAGIECRAAAGVCDIAETCDGNGSTCPADQKSTDECRPAAGACDPAEFCDGSGDDCAPDVLLPDATDCSDATFCDGPEECQSGACVSAGPPPCTAPSECNDSEDRCGCPAAPALACRSAGKTALTIKDNQEDLFDKLVWQWIRGESTAQAELGDPTVSTDYALCVYAGATNERVAEAALPPGGFWRQVSDKGFKYKDLTLVNDGVLKLVVKGSDRNTAIAAMKGRGPALPDMTLPLELPVTAQLINGESGICLGSNFGAAEVSENRAESGRPGLFKAKKK